ncbi:MAG: 2-phospho-L-lactate transferase CofD family protein [bacterium]
MELHGQHHPASPPAPARAGGESAAPLITVLCGGLGGARLALALQAAGAEDRSCFVTNVADDCESGGLRVCPDTDAVSYALAGLFDEGRGWGIRGDVFPASQPGGHWFHVGERDRRNHLARAALLAAGLSLSAASARLAAGLGVRARILPASDDDLRTHIHTPRGVLAWQEWLVRERAEPPVTAVEYRGLAAARPSEGVLAAVRGADLLVLAASSPMASIVPTLALPGVLAAIRARRGPTVAISPVVLRRPVLTESDARRAQARAMLLAAVGCAHHPVAVAESYAGLIDAYVLDEADAADAGAIERLGLQPLVAPTYAAAGASRLIAALRSLLPTQTAGWRPAPC